jgi:hypothetical protein
VRVVAVRQVQPPAGAARGGRVRPAARTAEARPAAPRRFRIPRLRLRSTSRLEGVELPLPPLKGEVVRVPSGYLVIGDGVIRAYAEREGPWGPLQPLVDYRETQEIFISEQEGIVHITAGIAGKRYVVELPRELVVERLAQRIAIAAGIPLSERNPQDSGEFHGWRVNLAIPQIAGGWQISAARVVKVEPLRAQPLLLARLAALSAAPNSLIFVGPPGSGKTTALDRSPQRHPGALAELAHLHRRGGAGGGGAGFGAERGQVLQLRRPERDREHPEPPAGTIGPTCSWWAS